MGPPSPKNICLSNKISFFLHVLAPTFLSRAVEACFAVPFVLGQHSSGHLNGALLTDISKVYKALAIQITQVLQS